MSKAKAISDFSALKSLLAELPAESQCDIGRRPEEKSGQTPVKDSRMEGKRDGSGQGIKPGTRVILMDSDLNGKVLEAGRKVKIELEDGLTIDVEYGEFATTDSEEEKKLIHSAYTGSVGAKGMKLSSSKTSPNIRETSPNSIEVDLHIEKLPGGRAIPAGRRLEFQMEYFRSALRSRLRHRGMKITFIHGVGDGILRHMVCKELEEVFALHCSWSSSPAATVVTIR